MRIIKLEGTPKVMGECFGETFREDIQEFYALRLNNALTQAAQYGDRKLLEGDVLSVASECLSITEGYDRDGYLELVSTARAANLSPEQLWSLNGLTDLRDILAWSDLSVYGGGCSSFIVQGDLTADGHVLCGQTWDLATDNMPYVIGVNRVPHDGPQTWCLTTVGCLSLIGMNEEGLAIGTTNLRTKDAQSGICYLSIIHKVLAQKEFEPAINCITKAQRAGGHYYYLCDAQDNAAAIECTAQNHVLKRVTQGHHVECNHIVSEEQRGLEADTPKASSLCRISRMNHLIASADPGSLGPENMIGFLSDHEDGDGAICRHDLNDVSSNGAVVMSPANHSMTACHGYPCSADWIDVMA